MNQHTLSATITLSLLAAAAAQPAHAADWPAVPDNIMATPIPATPPKLADTAQTTATTQAEKQGKSAEECEREAAGSGARRQEVMTYCLLGQPVPKKQAPRPPAPKKEGVSIGMTRDQVLKSNWGRPTDINESISTRGTREQWVYGIGNYLYFENGILTSVQRRR